MSETASESVNSDPEPPGPERYINSVIDLSYQLGDSLPSVDWQSERESFVTLRPSRIVARLSAQAFLNYANLSEDQLVLLEDKTAIAMSSVDGLVPAYEMQPMMSNWPLIFDHESGAIIGRRNDEKKEIEFTSDTLLDQKQYRVLLGGLAAVLYYTDFPGELDTTVE
ncbi:hypothetical protein D3C73_19910 [compost metagenome]